MTDEPSPTDHRYWWVRIVVAAIGAAGLIIAAVVGALPEVLKILT